MTTPTSNRRYNFISELYRIGSSLTSPAPHRVSDARRTLAHLRRGLTGDRQGFAAHDWVFQHDPPGNETETWLLIAGLFALHPMPMKISANTTFGAPMGVLARTQKTPVTRRFTQLLGQNPAAFPHYLRQCVQLLNHGDQRVDYRRLLDDIIVLAGPDHHATQAQHVRLQWVRDFHRNARTDSPTATTSPHATTDSEETTA